MTVIEFYDKKTGKIVTSVDSSMVPPPGALMSIAGTEWKVLRTTYAVDYSGMPRRDRIMRANVDLEWVKN